MVIVQIYIAPKIFMNKHVFFHVFMFKVIIEYLCVDHKVFIDD